ncbi:thiol reductant ABC exporter subunit CydC [Sporolactobacillus sp. THM7-4]|nr:thiol reductant ABC exporter subunit CydC [Sporolactobacillus sp. THM7-4]
MRTWFFPFMRRHSGGLILSAGFSLAGLICAAGLLFTSGYLISKASLRPENILMIYVPIVGVRAFGIFRAVFQYSGRLAGHDTILRILSEMRVRLYRMIEPAALFIRSRYRTGDILGILSDDIEHLQDIYLRTVIPGFTAVLIYALWIGLVGWMDARFAFMMAGYLLILLVIFPLLSLFLTGKVHDRLAGKRHLLYEKLTDAVLGAGDWIMSGRQGDFLRTHEEREEKVLAIERHIHRLEKWRDLISHLIIGVCVLSLVYWSGSMTASGHMDGTLIAAFVLVIFTISESLIPVSEAVEKLPQYRKSFERLREAESLPGNGKKTELLSSDRRDNAIERVEIHADHLFFKYKEDEDWAINDVSLDIHHGEKVALIGRSGAGKSTLIHLIYGSLVPAGGTVTLNGTPACSIGDGITSWISVLNQNPHLFDTTIYNNLALGNQKATRDEIIHAAKLVGLHEMIENLPQGYETRMHEAGTIFSGGEQERLALARILLREAPAVILDEPTVGLDPITEKNLLETIFHTLEGKTLIWITHHLTGMEKMNQVIFLENGKTGMHGRHAELLKTSERYRRLYRLDVPEKLERSLLMQNETIIN